MNSRARAQISSVHARAHPACRVICTSRRRYRLRGNIRMRMHTRMRLPRPSRLNTRRQSHALLSPLPRAQDFEIIGRGKTPQLLCGVFIGCPQQLSVGDFKRAVARAALAFAPATTQADDGADPEPLMPMQKLRWLFETLVARVQTIKLPGASSV
eukprot:6187170-Pleurochrysis_carterae.AAC.2